MNLFTLSYVFCHCRWVRGICEAIRPLESMSIEELIRLWAHEALRLFHDRLVLDSERQGCNSIDILKTSIVPLM